MTINGEIELEVIQMLAYTDLCKAVGIEPVVEITPGRDYDEDGELASWYEDLYYPDFTKTKQKKLLNSILAFEEAPALIAYIAKLLADAGKLNKEEVKNILEGKRTKIKKD